MPSQSILFALGAALGISLAIALQQPIVGVLFLLLFLFAPILGRTLGIAPWIAISVKLSLLFIATFIVLFLFGGELIPVNPDQNFYYDTIGQIACALRENPLCVDYNAIVGLHNRSYSVVLGWLAFLNGRESVLLCRLFNILLSLLLAGLAYGLACVIYPQKRTRFYVFLGAALLPSINMYTLFVLRDVLIAVLTTTFIFGTFARRYWLTLLSLVLTYYTRFQLFFLFVGSMLLYIGLRLVSRLGFSEKVVKSVFVAMFVLTTYFLAPLVLPPEYEYTQTWGLAGFGRFLGRFIPSFVGIDFLFTPQEMLELSRPVLAIARGFLFDSWALPILFLMGFWFYKRAPNQWKEIYLWTWAFIASYAVGYWHAYGRLMIRLWIPLYPLLLVVAAPIAEALLSQPLFKKWLTIKFHRTVYPAK
ncbi:MAG: hypothetical protein ABDI20_05410 [Candidatus Bipolaricaulaceae bacterium]